MSNCFPLLAIFNFSNLGSASSATTKRAAWILIRTPIPGRIIGKPGGQGRTLKACLTRGKVQNARAGGEGWKEAAVSHCGFPQRVISSPRRAQGRLNLHEGSKVELGSLNLVFLALF